MIRPPVTVSTFPGAGLPPWVPEPTPAAAAIFGGFLLFSAYQWLRWRSRMAWLDRVWLEVAGDRADGDDADPEPQGGSGRPNASDGSEGMDGCPGEAGRGRNGVRDREGDRDRDRDG